MLAMTCLTEYASKGVDSIIRKMVNDIFGRDDILERLPIYFMKESYKRKSKHPMIISVVLTEERFNLVQYIR